MEQCIDFQCKHIELDPHFVTFYNWAKDSNIPVVILSGGLRPLILALLTKLLGSEEASKIELISNDIEYTGDEYKEGVDQRKWKVKFHDESDLGCDKAVQIEKYIAKYRGLTDAERPALLFAGDGITDLCAAGSCDLLFAKAGKGTAPIIFLMHGYLGLTRSVLDLVTYCENENIAFTTFEDWREIFHATKSIL
jgi:2-hydroxy-3-keto-5-methylthiopentenyl-1-phosphate phosphatase